jgi:dihydroorotase
MSLLIKNAKLLSNGLEVVRNILIEDGKIKSISSGLMIADEIIDAEENYVIPGMIDCHVHFREPGLSHKEDWSTASYASAKGGVTTVIDMPNTIPPTFTLKDLEDKRRIAREKSIVNFGFYFGASSEDNTEEIRKAENVAGTKIYMNNTTGSLLIENLELIEKMFRQSRIAATHAEQKQLEQAVEIAKKTNKRLYLCHLSLKSEVDYLKENKTSNIFCEVTPHHLFLTEDDFKKQKGFAKMLPSLKTKADQKALWEAIDYGVIDSIGTDHAPHTKEEKESDKSPSGIPGVETVLPLLFDAVNKEKITLQKVVELTSRNPANIFGIKNKGLLRVGYDADLVIIDMNLEKKVKNEELLTKCKWSPFAGKTLKGWPITTIVNGKIVYHGGEIIEHKADEVVFNGI